MLRWQDLVWKSDEELGRYDIAEVNLACARGLPGAESVDVPACVEKVNAMADYCGQWIDWHRYRYHENPAEFNNSMADFYAVSMDSAMKHGFGIRYNPALLKDGQMDLSARKTVADVFIHGLLFGEGGCCTSMPVLYAAVARRLGYPIKLVSAVRLAERCGHLFARWDGGGERFNIEVTNYGLSSSPDEYYRTGAYEIDEKEIRLGCLLQSKTPRQELAGFLAERGYCWLAEKNDRETCRAFLWAYALNPENKHLLNRVWASLDEWVARLRREQPEGFPELQCRSRERHFPDTLPLQLERNFNCLGACETILNDAEHEERWWGPMRRRERLTERPSKACCEWTGNQMVLSFQFSAPEEAIRGMS